MNTKLGKIEDAFESIAKVSNSTSQIIEALKSNNIAKAVEVVLEFCEIDDEIALLKDIKTKTEGGETIEAIIGTIEAPALMNELVRSTKREIIGNFDNIKELMPSIAELMGEITKKIANIQSAAASWSFAEKMGTPTAAQNTLKKAKALKGNVEEAKTNIEKLLDSIDEM